MDQIWGSMAQYHEIQWGWKIAVYLFIAGLSAGAVISALLIKWSTKQEDYSSEGLIKAGAMIAPLAIIIGQGLLVFDLGKPFSFYLLMLHYQFHSVMSIGVVLLIIYSVLSVIYSVIIFKQKLLTSEWTECFWGPIKTIIEWIEASGIWFESLLCFSAISIAAYTGFLLSVLEAKPLLNVSLLPLLFLISGMSAGVAANIIVGVTVFKAYVQQHNLKYLLSLDMKLIPAELFVLFLMFTGLFNMGGTYAATAQQALTTGVWAIVFWVGVVGIGLVLPAIVAMAFLHKAETTMAPVTVTAGMLNTATAQSTLSVPTLLFNAMLVMIGVVLLRFYVLFAGQIFVGN